MIWHFTMTDKAEDFMVSVVEEVVDRQMAKIFEKQRTNRKMCVTIVAGQNLMQLFL